MGAGIGGLKSPQRLPTGGRSGEGPESGRGTTGKGTANRPMIDHAAGGCCRQTIHSASTPRRLQAMVRIQLVFTRRS